VRFAFGLFVPPIRDELSLAADVVGVIGALPLISFVLAALVAPLAADRLGARIAAMVSGSLGVGGLALISRADDALLLGAGVFACGVCTGLMMPALTAGMQAMVDRSMHGRVSSVMNAGTSIGVMVAVPAALLLAGDWRWAYKAFALLAALGVFASAVMLPAVSRITPADAAPPPRVTALQWWRLARLSLFAFVMGFVSAGYWVFAPDLVISKDALSPAQASGLWLAVGLAGLGGAIAADLADRNNPAITQALMLMMLAAGLSLLAASPGQLPLAMFSAMVFGLAYMSLTGLYLMTGIRLLPGRLSLGPVLPFIAVALGQAAGSPVVGVLVQQLGYSDAFSAFAALGVVAALCSPLYPSLIDYGPVAEAEDQTGLQAAYDQQLQDEDGEPLQVVAVGGVDE